MFFFVDKFILLTHGKSLCLYSYHLDPVKNDLKRLVPFLKVNNKVLQRFFASWKVSFISVSLNLPFNRKTLPFLAGKKITYLIYIWNAFLYIFQVQEQLQIQTCKGFRYQRSAISYNFLRRQLILLLYLFLFSFASTWIYTIVDCENRSKINLKCL